MKKSVAITMWFLILGLSLASPALWAQEAAYRAPNHLSTDNSPVGETATNNPLVNSNTNLTSLIPVQACQDNQGNPLCRWNNIQVEYLQTRMIKWSTAFSSSLIIKGKDKEITLTFGSQANLAVQNTMASCERMALASRAGQGLLSFYVTLVPNQGASIEEAFQTNKVSVFLDTTNNGVLELGCFLTSGN